jgi:nicotinamide-nucleotide amidase
MRCEILTIGTELLLGFTVDTNAGEIGRRLAAAGIVVPGRVTVADDEGAIAGAVRSALERSGAVITSGGLGPTADDLTVAAVARMLGRAVVRNPEWLARLEELYRLRAQPMPASNATQADLPEGATLLDNPAGTAPGVWLEDGDRLIVMLPGVPRELIGLMDREVMPRLIARWAAGGAGARVVRSRTLRTTGIGESALADLLGDPARLLQPGVSLAFIPTLAGTDLRLTAWELPAEQADAALERSAQALAPKLGAHCYAEGEADLAAIVVRMLEEEKATLAVAESCTGGLLGARVTAVSGSSRVFEGGVVAYSNPVKMSHLGVSADLLAAHGAVSEEVARAMAEGVAHSLPADAAIAITGIAGPDGGSDAKPVGTVWVAVRWRGTTRAFTWIFPGEREDVRQRAAQWALDRLRRIIAESR